MDQTELKPTLRAAASPAQEPSAAVRRPALRRRGLYAILVLLVVVAAFGVWWSMQRPAAVHYVTAPVTRGAITRTVAATGTVNPELTVIVGTYVSGVIQQLYCDYNTKVKPGQICAKIDPRPYQTVVDQDKANLAIAKAQLEKDKANLAYLKLDHERKRHLAERQFAAQSAADLAKSTYDQGVAQIGLAEATIQQRQATLDAAQVNLDYTDITSPVDGTVVSRNVTQGQTVAASFQTPTLFLIATDLTKMQVDTNVSESDIGGVKEGDPATFTVDAFPKRIFRGKVTQVLQSPQTVQNVVTFDAVVGVANHDMALKPGMTAATRIVVAERRDVLRVPNQALRFSPGGLATVGAPARLWVLRDGRPVAVPVRLGLDDDNFTEVLSVSGDLHAGDPVIVAEANDRPATPR
jgi:HlyD family secretion protein